MLLLVGAETWKLPEPLREDRRLSWISKPSRRETLFDALCRVMEVTQRVSAAAVTPAAPPGGLTGARVLVAEDNAFNRELVRILLEERGAKVDEAGDGEEALQACAGADYDLVLMDIHMPRLDGQATARRLREQAGDRRLPAIIALTADVFSRIPEELDDVLHKPVTTEALDTVLARWFPRPAAGLGVVDGGLRAAGTAVMPAALVPRLHGEVRRLCGQLQAAMLGMDRVAIRERAHQLKGLCGYYGLPALTGLARELEQRAERGTALELQGLLEGIESCLPPEGTAATGAEAPAPS
jgi:CheY-like chemotaxis protein